VDQPADLFTECGDQARMRMPQPVDRDAGQRVELFFALFIGEPRPSAVRERDGKPVVGVHQVRHGALRAMAERKNAVLEFGSRVCRIIGKWRHAQP
jgi:hypothetical protein